MIKVMRTIGLVLGLSVVFATSIYANAPHSDEVVIEATGQMEIDTSTILIKGTISSGEGQWITLSVHSPSGNLFYLNQVTSGTDGSFSFAFPYETKGTYSYALNASGLKQKVVGQISEPKPTDPPDDGEDPTDPKDPKDPKDPTDPKVPDSSIGYSGLPVPDADRSVWQVPLDELDEAIAIAEERIIVLDMPDGVNEINIPIEALDTLGEYQLVLKRDNLIVLVNDVSVLFAHVSEEARQGARIIFAVNQVAAEDGDEDGNEDGEFVPVSLEKNVQLRTAGDRFKIRLYVLTEAGEEIPFANGTVTLTIPYQPPAEVALLGIYRYDEASGQWAYKGGTVNEAEAVLSEDLSSFSIYTVLEYEKKFDDVASIHWAWQAIRSLSAHHIIKGMDETNYAPKKQVTRAEFAALLARMLKLEAIGESPFRDVRAGDWFAQDVIAAYEAGIIHGRSQELFDPHAQLTRQEMAVMLNQSVDLARIAPVSNRVFHDHEQIAAWALNAVQTLSKYDLVVGDHTGHFNPNHPLTRAEAAQAIYNIYGMQR